jgi:hypothetical protein
MDSVYPKRKNAKLEIVRLGIGSNFLEVIEWIYRNYQEPTIVKRRGST